MEQAVVPKTQNGSWLPAGTLMPRLNHDHSHTIHIAWDGNGAQ